MIAIAYGSGRAACGLLLVCALLVLAAGSAHAQRELLPVDHPATRVLVRLYEFGAISEFPREHLPISRGLALRFLDAAASNASLPENLRAQAAYYRDELAADVGRVPTRDFIPVSDSSRALYTHLGENDPLAIMAYRDTVRGIRAVLEPALDLEVRRDPSASRTTLIAQGGVQARGTFLGHVGFSARVTNGSVAGDSLLAARDPRIRFNGSFGVTGFGRDLSFGDGHLRADWDLIAIELGHEKIQLGGATDESLLLGSHLPANTDYLRLTAHLGRFTYSQIHASLMGAATGQTRGPFAEIPEKYIAAHLLSFGPFAGLRASLGESVIYHGRGFDLGYLNPLVFMKTQEQYELDRDNANLYLALSYAPMDRLFVEGEAMVDDLRFSLIGDDAWNNKTAWRLAVRATGFPVDAVDLAAILTHLEPYIFTHFNPLNNYTHNGVVIAGPGLEPNSDLAEFRLRWTPLPSLSVEAATGYGRHGANLVARDSATGADTVLWNVGGDVGQTRRAMIDSEHVAFLDGVRETRVRAELNVEYEPIRNVYVRLAAIWSTVRVRDLSLHETETREPEIRVGLRVGAH